MSRSALPRVGETSGFAKGTVSLSGTTLAGLLLLTPFLSIYPVPVHDLLPGPLRYDRRPSGLTLHVIIHRPMAI